ncbi:MAG: T9SS type A sorting domain-containing protein [bacterium]
MKTRISIFLLALIILIGLSSSTVYSQTAASVLWKLIVPDSTNPSTIVGNVTGERLTGTNLYIRSYSGTPNGPLGTSHMRWWPSADGGTTGSMWGPESVEVSTRYVQFVAAPKSGNSFTVDSASAWILGGGTSGIRVNIYYSIDPAFTTKTKLNPGDTAIYLNNSGSVTISQRVAFAIGKTINPGQSFYFRIYPWYTGATSNSKYLYTQLAEIKGTTKVTTAVDDDIHGIIPQDMQLHQNFPNPFNPATNIVYSIPKESYVTLEVIDMLGRTVSTLVNESKSAGTYTVSFDASKISSGMYLYRLTSDGHTLLKKMTILK